MYQPHPQELMAFWTTKLALKASSPPRPEPNPPDGTRMKIESQEGSCRYLINRIDSEVLAALPENMKAEIPKFPDSHQLFFIQCIDTCHIICVIRQTEVNPILGRWTFIEAQMDPGELRFAPEGKSALAWRRVLAVIAAFGHEHDPVAWAKFVKEQTPHEQ